MEQDMLIGRERELATLSDLLESAIERRPKLVLCGGEPGIGKTRLAMRRDVPIPLLPG